MTLSIADGEITSEQTPHTATAWPVPGEPTGWSVTWLPGRNLTRNQAITAMTLAEMIDRNGLWDYRSSANIDAWAAELGLTGPQAIEMLGGVPHLEDPDAT
jgi:hypothetical protein